jgi:hypothetical protein
VPLVSASSTFCHLTDGSNVRESLSFSLVIILLSLCLRCVHSLFFILLLVPYFVPDITMVQIKALLALAALSFVPVQGIDLDVTSTGKASQPHPSRVLTPLQPQILSNPPPRASPASSQAPTPQTPRGAQSEPSHPPTTGGKPARYLTLLSNTGT